MLVYLRVYPKHLVALLLCICFHVVSAMENHPQIAGANPDPAEEQQAQSESHGTQDTLLRLKMMNIFCEC